MTMTAPQHTADLVLVDRALESWRDSGYDLTAAVGEVVDNSIEAKATHIRIRTTPVQVSGAKAITTVAFADDGIGIPLETLPHVLSMGYSTRYGKRDGMGRFGVGLKLATLSLAERIDIYTRTWDDKQVWRVSLDLQEIRDGVQKLIVAEPVDGWPAEHADLMARPADGPWDAGTLIVWSKIDRLTSGGTYKTDLASQMATLQTFLARAYRKFIDNGVQIEVNGRAITLHDPLFLLENPRVKAKLKKDVRGSIVQRGTLTVDGQDVSVTVALAPETLRKERFKGGSQIAQDLHIPENEGRISFVRQGREINYDQVAKMFPSRIGEPDRYIGIEVEFPATLDEFFQVRHIKRGVVPVDKLRSELKEWLDKPIKAARKQIKDLWDETKAEQEQDMQRHQAAAEAAARADRSSPRGRAGSYMSDEDVDKALEEVAEHLAGSSDEDGERQLPSKESVSKTKKELKETVETLPFTIVDGSWPGRELLDITHLNGKAIIRINNRHPFFKEIYDPLSQMASRSVADIESAGSSVLELLQKVERGIEWLLMGYAKAENMDRDPDGKYADLRSFWGQFTAANIREGLSL